MSLLDNTNVIAEEASTELRYSRFDQSKSQICKQEITLTDSLQWAAYTNSYDNIFYENDQRHALSLYLDGGFETQRVDQTSGLGAPGLFCLLPQGASSQWQLGAPQNFVHLYFDDNYLKQLALQVFDIDPRTISLPELNFAEDPMLEGLIRHGIVTTDWSNKHENMAQKQVTDTILVSMLQRMVGTRKTVQVTGGLTPKAIRLVTDFMEVNYQRQVYLSELAQLAQLSEYHFCRMFKVSMAQTPQAYLLAIRLGHVKRLMLNPTHTLADIALACGFANQSHMGRNFKSQHGVTPTVYRRSILT